LRRSNYGATFQQLYSEFGADVDRHTTVVILGDARNNQAPPRTLWLRRLRDRARHIIWLNPERRALWDSGDSMVSRYATHCDRVLECRNLQQLRAVVRELTWEVGRSLRRPYHRR
jgi:hypothetical protein